MIYIEIFLFINIMISLITLIIIHEVSYIKYSKLIILGQAINTIYLIFFIYNYKLVYYLKYLIPFFIVYLSFKTNIYTYIKATLIYYLLSFLYGGVGTLIHISGNIKYLIMLVVSFVFFIIIYIFFKNKRIDIYYQLKYIFLNKEYKINAFLDTGCNIFYKGYPVIILNNKYNFNIIPIDYIEISSGLSKNKTPIFYIDKLFVGKKQVSVYCVFLDIDYDAIIGFDVL